MHACMYVCMYVGVYVSMYVMCVCNMLQHHDVLLSMLLPRPCHVVQVPLLPNTHVALSTASNRLQPAFPYFGYPAHSV